MKYRNLSVENTVYFVGFTFVKKYPSIYGVKLYVEEYIFMK